MSTLALSLKLSAIKTLSAKAYDPTLNALLTELGYELITESGDYITSE